MNKKVFEIFKRKEFLFIIIGILIIGVAFSLTFTWKSHSANAIKIRVSGNEMSLQDAWNGGYLAEASSELLQDTNSFFTLGHKLENIFVSVDGVEMTLKDAVESKNLCASVESYYTSSIEFGHNADEILIVIDGETLSLQDSINRGDYCYVPVYVWETEDWGSCSMSCGPGTQYREVVCRENKSWEISDNSLCNSATKPSESTSCEIKDCCTTYSGYGAGVCPFGFKSYGQYCRKSDGSTGPRARVCSGDCYNDCCSSGSWPSVKTTMGAPAGCKSTCLARSWSFQECETAVSLL